MSEREDVEALAAELRGLRKGGVGLSPVGAKIGAQAVLASDWLAAHDERVRASERERLAGEVEANHMSLLLSAERVDEARDNRRDRDLYHRQIRMRDDWIQRLVASISQHKTALNVALAYARSDIGWNDDADEELAGCQIVLDKPVPSDG